MTVLELITAIVGFFDDTHILVLAPFAFIAHQAALTYFGVFPWKSAAKFITAPCVIGFAMHAAWFIDFQEEIQEAFLMLLRSALVACIIQNAIAVPLMFAVHLSTRAIQQEWAALRQYSDDLSTWYQERSTQQPQMTRPIEVIPREVSLAQITEQAKMDYEFECVLIDSAGLEEEETEAARNQAKQKYLKRLSNALQ